MNNENTITAQDFDFEEYFLKNKRERENTFEKQIKETKNITIIHTSIYKF